MTLTEALTVVTQVLYLTLALITLRAYVQFRDRTRLDVALVFVSLGVAIIAQDLQTLFPTLRPVLGVVFFLSLLAQPYLLLRVARYFRPVPALVQRAALIGLLVVCAALLLSGVAPLPVFTAAIAYFLVVEGYATFLLVQGALTISGVTGSRLRLASAGSGLLALIFLMALGMLLVGLLVELPPSVQSVFSAAVQVMAILSGLSYYLGFAPPRWLRRFWQLSELQRFLRQTPGRLAYDRAAIFAELSEAALRAVGGVGTIFADCDEAGQHLTAQLPADSAVTELEREPGVLGEAWRARRARVIHVPDEAGPQLIRWAETFGARALLAVPVVGRRRPWGVLLVALRYAPLFAQDDLDLLAMLAEQSALALDYAPLVEELRAVNQSLEQRVAERTATLAQAQDQLRQVAGRAQSMADLSRALAAAYLDYQVVLDIAARRIAEMFDGVGMVRLISDDGLWLDSMGIYHPDPDVVARTRAMLAAVPMQANEGLSGQVVASGQPVLIPVTSTDQLRASTRPEYGPHLEHLSIHSVLIVPVRARGAVLGIMSLGRLEPGRPYTPDDQALLQEVGDRAGLAIVNAQLFTRVQRELAERQRAEEAVLAGEARYHSTLDTMLEGAQIIGFDYRYLYVNDAVVKQGRASRETLLGHTMMEVYPGIEKTEFFEVLRQCMVERAPRLLENEFTYPDGARGWFELSIQPVPEGSFILSIDITEHKRAEEEIRRSAARAQALAEISRAFAEVQLDHQAVLDIAVQRAVERIGDLCVIRLVSEDRQWLKVAALHAADPEALAMLREMYERVPQRFDEGLGGRVVQTRQPMLIPELTADQMRATIRPEFWPYVDRFGPHTVVLAPIVRPGESLGYVAAMRHQPNAAYTTDDLTFLQELADRAGLALANARLYQEAQHELVERQRAEEVLRERELNARSLLRLSRRLEQAQTYSDALEAALEEVKAILGYQNVWTYLLSEDGQHLQLLTTFGEKSQMIADDFPILTIGEDRFLREIVESSDVVLVQDARIDPRTDKAIVAQLGNRTIVNVPIQLMDTRLGAFGTGSFGEEGVRVPTPTELDYLRALASNMAVALDRIHLLFRRRQVEEQIRKLNEDLERRVVERTAQLAETTNFLDSVIENLPIMVFVKDALDLRFARFNKAAEALIGYPRESLLGKNDYDFFPASEADFFTAKDRQVLAGNQIVDIAEETIQTAHQGVRHLHTRKVPIAGADGVPKYLLGISEDITERKQAEEEIVKLNDDLERRAIELEATNKELEAFSYSVSHDLRAPLRTIDGFSLALLEDYGDRLDAEGHDHLRRVRAATQHMGQLIDDMLNLSRVTRAEMRREAVDLGALADAILVELRKTQPEREVEVVVAEALKAQGDPRLLRAALQNLLANAWKFTARQPQARIEMGALDRDGEGVYFVRDNGAGFDMTYANKLFGVFQRLHRATEFPGTGVGLATVQRIIHRHGGRVWAEGAPGQGATFYFTLPEGGSLR